jgi:Glycosyl hydrolase family 63 C-terminal domain
MTPGTMREKIFPADAEKERLAQAGRGELPWKKWGPYLSERQWGTVREDYSESGDSWGSFPHDHARSRAYRWGEDGTLGVSDDNALLCFALALWNGKDCILKERMFGLSNPEGNHGEDVKECYYYLDATPTSSYLKGLYKYPQAAYPYQLLVDESRRRSRSEPEFEIIDSGIFDGGRYFDVFVEYAKAGPEDILIRITAANRGPEAAPLHLLPTLWFRNTWSWQGGYEHEFGKPSMRMENGHAMAEHVNLGRFRLAMDAPNSPEWLFTENETNTARLWDFPNAQPYVKDAFHEYVVHGRSDAVNPERTGTKVAPYVRAKLPAGGSVTLRLRLSKEEGRATDPWGDFESVFDQRIREADAFYDEIPTRPQDKEISRQALAGLLWTNQFYYYGVRDWLQGDPVLEPPPARKMGRNAEWSHLFSHEIIAMPDKWEFPWFAAWDLAFHTVPLALVDLQFAREQLLLMLREWYMNPNGQLAAYEYNFGDVNPPVHAWACRVLAESAEVHGRDELDFLKRIYTKLALNFTWWVNRKDSHGKNLFSGGFLGLDNIGAFDRSMPLPPGVELEQADGTAWMAIFSLEMLRISLALTREDPAWEDAGVKFIHHFTGIQSAINSLGGAGLWDEQDGFYYDKLLDDGRHIPLRLRSVVGLLPLAAAMEYDEETLFKAQGFRQQTRQLLRRHPFLYEHVQENTVPGPDGQPMKHWLVSLPSRHQLESIFRYLFDENEFLSPYGIRSLSRYYKDHPFSVHSHGQELHVEYLPGESDDSMFGGNSNWRGPVWFPINAIIVEALETYYRFYGDSFQVEFPTGSGRRMNLMEARNALAERLIGIFRPDENGRRPCHGDSDLYAKDPHWKDLILFNEYFHADTGRGCGASHQTGWTGLVAVLCWLLARWEKAAAKAPSRPSTRRAAV